MIYKLKKFYNIANKREDNNMVDLKSEKSIILSLGDLKLSDTEYTLKNEKMINGIYYKPIFSTLAWRDGNFDFYKPYDRMLYHLVVGDGKAGVEISKGNDTIFYGYGANRFSSNASNIILGFLDSEYSYFINECFDPCTIYDKEPELSSRNIIQIFHWQNENAKYTLFPILNVHSINKVQIKKKAISCWEILEPRIMEFTAAFKDEQLNQLSLRRKR